jgi:hypothetical protein
MAVCLTAAAVALAQQPTPSQLSIQSEATIASGGTKKKPKPVSIKVVTTTSTDDGSRQETFSEIDSVWAGIRSNGKYWPKCTADEIDLAQSDADCPKGSLIATGTLLALVGPENDFSNPGIECRKDVHLYNAGQNKVTTILVGPAAECAGVDYLAPWEIIFTKKGGIAGGQKLVNKIPPNISHPLPGVLGSTTELTTNYKKLVKKVDGKKVGYLESIGCKGKRKTTESVVTDPTGQTLTAKGDSGNC